MFCLCFLPHEKKQVKIELRQIKGRSHSKLIIKTTRVVENEMCFKNKDDTTFFKDVK